MRRPAAWLLGVSMLAACTPPGGTDGSPAPFDEPSTSAVVVKTGSTTAMQAMRELCVQPKIVGGPITKRPTPPAISEVESEVESVRDLEFLRPVNVEPVTDAEMDRRLSDYFHKAYPRRYYARRTDVWATIGAIPEGVGILEALNRYQQGQVLGFYNSQNEELVYTGGLNLNRIEQYVLAHELTHAIDDQHFDLDRLDELSQSCDDERLLAALGAVEGSANHFATQVVLRYPVTEIGDLGGGDLSGVPQLIIDLQAYPYLAGQTFVDALANEGGPAAVNRALRTFPTTTEQVLHPSAPGRAEPTPVDIPDFGPTFGSGWRDHDVMVVGEEWLRALLHTRLAEPDADRAAAGWNGGIYRAWSDGAVVAVILRTVWDTPAEAAEFREALDHWVRLGSRPALVLEADGTAVDAGFASSEDVMGALSAVLRSL